MNMQYVKIDGATATINVEGRFDLCKTPDVLAGLNAAYQTGCTKVVVDFMHTSFIDSSAVNVLTKIQRKVKSENFSAKNASGAVLALLKTGNLDEWLQVNPKGEYF